MKGLNCDSEKYNNIKMLHCSTYADNLLAG